MVLSLTTPPIVTEIEYPDSDGQPMADNTLQFQWIVIIKENLELLFRDAPDVFVAGDLLWYPVEGQNTIRRAPDAMVAIGRPKGYRGSYQQWREDNIAPQVVFEILSPGNRLAEMSLKFDFYQRYGVEEYYLYDPDDCELLGWIRQQEYLRTIEAIDNWVSPRLGIIFQMKNQQLQILRPDGKPFLSFLELDQLRQEAENRAELAESRAEKLAAYLRSQGLDPDAILLESDRICNG